MALLFPRSTKFIDSPVRGEQVRFYPVGVWSVWTGQLKAISGLMGAVAKIVGLMLTRPAGETVEQQDEANTPGAPGDYFRRITPPTPEAMSDWSTRLAAAWAEAWTEGTKPEVLETFCFLLLDSLRDRGPVTMEAARDLAREMDIELFMELVVGFTKASISGASKPMKLAVEKWVKGAVEKAKAAAQMPISTTSATP